MSALNPNLSRDKETPFIQSQQPPWRVDEQIKGWALFCPWDKKLSLKADELLDSQRHGMGKETGNHPIKDP